MYYNRNCFVFILFFFLLINCTKSKVEKPFSSESKAKIEIEQIFFSGIALDRYKVLTHLPSIQKDQRIEVDFFKNSLPQLAQIQFKTLKGTYHTQTTCEAIQTSPDGATETLTCTVTFVNKQYYGATAYNETNFPLHISRKLDLSGKEAKIVNLSFQEPSNYVFLNYQNSNNTIDYEKIQSDDIENFIPLKIGLIKNRIQVTLIYSELATQKSVLCSSNEKYQTCVYTVVSGDKKTTKNYHIEFWYFPELQNISSNVQNLTLLYAPASLQSLQADGKIDIQAEYFPELADLKIVARPTHQIIRDEKTKTFSLVFQNYDGQEIKYHLAFKSIVKITNISLDGKNNANWTKAMATWLSGKENEIQLKLDENQAYPKDITLDFSPNIWQIEKTETIGLSISDNPNELDSLIVDKTENGLLVPAYTQSPRRKIQVKNAVTQELLVYYLSFQATEVKIESFTIDPILLPIFSKNPQNWKPEEIIYIETLKMPKKEEISYQLKGENYSSSLSIDDVKRQVILEIQQNDGKKFKYILQFQTLTLISQKANEKYLKSQINIIEEYEKIGEYDQKNAIFKTFLDPKNDLFQTITLEDEEYAKAEQILNLSQKKYIIRVKSKKNEKRFVDYSLDIDFFIPKTVLEIQNSSMPINLGALSYSKDTNKTHDYIHPTLSSNQISNNFSILYHTFFDRLLYRFNFNSVSENVEDYFRYCLGLSTIVPAPVVLPEEKEKLHQLIQNYFNIKIGHFNIDARFSKIESKMETDKLSLDFFIQTAWGEKKVSQIVLTQDTQPIFEIQTKSWSLDLNRIGGGDLGPNCKTNLMEIKQSNPNAFHLGAGRKFKLVSQLSNYAFDYTKENLQFFNNLFTFSQFANNIPEDNRCVEVKDVVVKNFIVSDTVLTWKVSLTDQETIKIFNAEKQIKKEFTTIRTWQDLQAIKYSTESKSNFSFKQEKDIAFPDNTYFEPIGNSKAPFLGEYDGNNKIIKNLLIKGMINILTINTQEILTHYGLFGYVKAEKARNFKGIRLVNPKAVNIPLQSYTGFLIGRLDNLSDTVKIENCTIEKDKEEIFLAAVSPYYLGGLMGYYEGITSSKLYFTNNKVRISQMSPNTNNNFSALLLAYAKNGSITLKDNELILEKQDKKINIGFFNSSNLTANWMNSNTIQYKDQTCSMTNTGLNCQNL